MILRCDGFLLHQCLSFRVLVEVIVSPHTPPPPPQISWEVTNLWAFRKIALKPQQVFICNLLSKKANIFLPLHAYQCTILYTSRHFFNKYSCIFDWYKTFLRFFFILIELLRCSGSIGLPGVNWSTQLWTVIKFVTKPM